MSHRWAPWLPFVLAAIGMLFHGHFLWSVFAAVGLSLGGPMMSLMYLSLIMNWVDSGRAAGLARGFANLGKMGLTGYLLESTLMSGVMTFWGLQRINRDAFDMGLDEREARLVSQGVLPKGKVHGVNEELLLSLKTRV